MNSWLARRPGYAASNPAARRARQHVVGVQRRELADLRHAFAAEQAHVDVGPEQHACIAHESRQTAYRLRQVGFGEPAIAVGVFADYRDGEERGEPCTDAHCACAGAAAAVRGGECFVQVHVDYVEAHVSRSHLAENRVEVGAVVVQQAACGVNDSGDFFDPAFEDAEVEGVGEHDARGLWADCGLQRFEIDVAIPCLRGSRGLHSRTSLLLRGLCRGRLLGRLSRCGPDRRASGDRRGSLLRLRIRRVRRPLALARRPAFLLLLSASPAARTCMPGSLGSASQGPAGVLRGTPEALRTGCRLSGCISSCTSPGGRSAYQWRSSAGRGA